MKQAAGRGDAADENSFAAAVFTSLDLGANFTFDPLAEAVHQKTWAAFPDRTGPGLSYVCRPAWLEREESGRHLDQT
jgi:hypothetical protein